MTTDFKTDTEVLIIAMRHWAKVVLANGGVAADTISQGADRLQELQARAELAEASAKLWEADALRYANNTEFWKDRTEKAEAALTDPQQLHVHCLRTLNEGQISHLFGERMTEIINRAEAAIRSERLWKEFITLMDITEESDSGNAFNPNKISSCRAMDGNRLNEILNEARQIVFDTPKE